MDCRHDRVLEKYSFLFIPEIICRVPLRGTWSARVIEKYLLAIHNNKCRDSGLLSLLCFATSLGNEN